MTDDATTHVDSDAVIRAGWSDPRRLIATGYAFLAIAAGLVGVLALTGYVANAGLLGWVPSDVTNLLAAAIGGGGIGYAARKP